MPSPNREQPTLSELRTRALDRVDMADTGFAVTARVNDYINKGLSELHDIVVNAHEDMLWNQYKFKTNTTEEKYALPQDTYKTGVVFYQDSAGDRYELDRFHIRELGNRDEYHQRVIHPNRYNFRYAIIGSEIWFFPKPDAVSDIELWYIPTFQKLIKETDKPRFYILPGWEEFAILDAAVSLRTKEEQDPTALIAEREAVRQRITRYVPGRDAGKPTVVQDINDRFIRNW